VVTQEDQRRRRLMSKERMEHGCYCCLGNSAREALPKDQWLLGAIAHEVILELCHVAQQTDNLHCLKEAQRQGQAEFQKLWLLVVMTMTVTLTVMRESGSIAQSALLLTPEESGFQSQLSYP
jgi:hypothetical protein